MSVILGSVSAQKVMNLEWTPPTVEIGPGLKPVKISLGREAMDIDGKPVFMVTQFESEDGSQSAAIIDIPSGTQSCLMYHTFDLTKIE